MARIGDDDPDLLRWFTDQAIRLDTHITLVEHRPFGGPLVAEISRPGQHHASIELGVQAATALWVADQPPTTPAVPTACPYPHCRHLP